MPGFIEPDRPAKFLGATVLSFNANLGLGSAQESTLTVDLIEDCLNSGDRFLPSIGEVEVGSPVVFPDDSPYNFIFGGILTSWTNNIDNGGETFKVTVADPRQLLENTAVILDTYMGAPSLSTNYINVYNYLEGSVLAGNCNAFGSSGASPERGMPLVSVLNALSSLNPVIQSPTGYNFIINWSSLGFLLSLPSYYRIPGPSVSILQLVQDACDALGYEFYVYMTRPNVINFGYVNLKIQPTSISDTISSFYGTATQLSYGQELRNDKTKSLLFGEQQHYISASNSFSYFFGEQQTANGFSYPVVPYAYSSNNGFWILKSIRDINITLFNPLPGEFYTLSELDIRCAMASFDLWFDRVMNPTVPGTLNAAIRSRNPAPGSDIKGVIDGLSDSILSQSVYYALNDFMVQPRANSTKYENVFQLDLEALHGWVQNLGNTYYGKQFLVGLPGTICAKGGSSFGELIFTDVPTNAGGWVEYGSSVIGLADPDLGLFRETDGRLGAFVRFNERDSVIPPSSGIVSPPESWPDYDSPLNPPNNPLE